MYKNKIKQVRELLDSPESWTKRFHAVDHNNKPVEFNSPYACRWCIRGAVLCVTKNNSEFNDVWDYMRDKSIEINDRTLISFNEGINTTHSDIIGFIDALLND